MITVLARLRVDSWDRFKSVHDRQDHLRRRREGGNLSHHVLTQLDDVTDVVYLDTWNTPQDADDFYFDDRFEAELADMGATLIELIKLEGSDAGSFAQGLPADQVPG